MEKNVLRTFKDETVNLDFSEYERCNFVNCKIHIDFGLTRVVDCEFHNCKIELGHPARTIAGIIKLFYPNTPIYFEGEETKEQVLEKMRKYLEGLSHINH